MNDDEPADQEVALDGEPHNGNGVNDLEEEMEYYARRPTFMAWARIMTSGMEGLRELVPPDVELLTRGRMKPGDADKENSSDSVYQRVSAHRVILAAASPYFRTMFFRDGAQFKESQEREIKLEDVDSVAIRHVVDFVYTGRIPMLDEIAQFLELFHVACLLQLQPLQEFCETELSRSHLTLDSALELRALSTTYSLSKLRIAVDEFICEEFTEFIDLNNWDVPADLVLDLIPLLQKNGSLGPERLYSLLIDRWVFSRRDLRVQYMPAIIKRIGFGLYFMSADFIQRKIVRRDSSLWQSDAETAELVSRAKAFVEWKSENM